MLQRTVLREINFDGIGLHSGKKARVSILPAPADTGIAFVRSDLEGAPVIPALVQNVVDTRLCTVIGKDGVTVGTIEHLMAAFLGLGIDNARVEVSGDEVPVMDGSSLDFVEGLIEVGVQTQLKTKRFLRLKKRVEIFENGKWASAEPCDHFEIHSRVHWDHPLIGEQRFHYVDTETDFAKDLAPARTFGFLKDVDAMRRMGLARGGSLENALVLDDRSVLNPEGLRFQDEFARHKVLDGMGDLALVGYALLGRFTTFKAGHQLHTALLKEVLRDASNFEIVVQLPPVSEAAESTNPALTRVAAY